MDEPQIKEVMKKSFDKLLNEEEARKKIPNEDAAETQQKELSVTWLEVKSGVKTMKIEKSGGVDELSVDMIKAAKLHSKLASNWSLTGGTTYVIQLQSDT